MRIGGESKATHTCLNDREGPHCRHVLYRYCNPMYGLTFFYVSLVLAVVVFGGPHLLGPMERLQRRLKADLEREFPGGAEARKAEALAAEEREATRRIADRELAKYARRATTRK